MLSTSLNLRLLTRSCGLGRLAALLRHHGNRWSPNRVGIACWTFAMLAVLFQPQTLAAAEEIKSGWLNPFAWTESDRSSKDKETSVDKEESRFKKVATKLNPFHLPDDGPAIAPAVKVAEHKKPAGKSSAGWNPFRWSNAPADQADASTGATERVGSGGLAATQIGSIPQSQSFQQLPPVDAGSVNQTAYQYGHQQWPVGDTRANAQQSSETDLPNPFAWSNAAPPTSVSIHPPSMSSIAEKARQPWQWTNSLQGRGKPQGITAPELPSIRGAIVKALQWSDQPEETPESLAASNIPPAKASHEELVEWERDHLPWIRPFYWADLDASELAQRRELASSQSSTVEGEIPFQSGVPAGFIIATDNPTNQVSPVAAMFQGGEVLPQPGVQFPDGSSNAEEDPFAGGEKEDLDGEGKGTLAEAESLGEAPVDNSLQFLRADTVLLKPGQFQFDYGFTYSKFDTVLPVIVTSGPTSSVELADFHIRELRVPLEIRYGLARRVQVFVNVPFGWVNTEFSIPGFEDFENDGGLGDIVFGSSILLRDNDPCNKPDTILTLSAVAPTGDEPFTPAGLSPSSPTLGGGTWSLGANMLFIQNYDPVVVFYGFGTRQHFEGEINGQDFLPGGEYNYQFGVGFGINRHVTFSTRFNGAYVTEADLNGQRVRGTIQEPMVLSMAMTVAKNKKLVEPFIDFGLTDDATDARFGITWTR